MTPSVSSFKKTRRSALLSAMVVGAGLAIAGCSTGGGAGLPTGLTASMEQPGAQLDRTEAMRLINQYRASRGAPPLTLDASLDAAAAEAAQQYASSGQTPSRPQAAGSMLVSAGYTNFAETFSGWRGLSRDADVIANAGANRAGIGVASNPSSEYGVHWVLLLAGGGSMTISSGGAGLTIGGGA